MKTTHNSQRSMRNWYGRLILLFAIFILQSSVSNIFAQAVQDELYIFRNDGKFNAFFFDDIDRFEYSKVDTLGVLHEDYVVQEVYALDSVFRIPISAIDSVAFVTPETVYKKDVVFANPDIVKYITASDSTNWIRLSANVPANLLPKKGDKWLIDVSTDLIPLGFGGRVVSVQNGDGGYTITTEALQVEEAFDRAVFKLAVGTPKPASARGPRKVTLYGSEKPIVIEPYKAKTALAGSKDIINNFDVASMSFSAFGGMEYNIEPQITARSTAYLDMSLTLHFDNYINVDIKTEFKAQAKGTLSDRLDLPFPHKAFFFREELGEENTPAYGKVLWKCGIFLEAAGELDFEGEFRGVSKTHLAANYERWGLSGQWYPEYSSTWEKDYYSVKKIYFSPQLNTGLMAEASIECYNPLLRGVGGLGLRAEIGRRLSAKYPVGLKISENLADTYWKDHVYDVLNYDEAIELNLYASLNPYENLYGIQIPFFTDTPKINIYDLKQGIVPNIYEFQVDRDEDVMPYKGDASFKMKRYLFSPVYVGLVSLNKDGEIDQQFMSSVSYLNPILSPTHMELNFTFDPLKDEETEYNVFPMTRLSLNPKPFLCGTPYNVKLDPANIDIDERKLYVNDEEGSEVLYFVPNMRNVELFCAEDWLTYQRHEEKGTLSLNWQELPEDMEYRKAVIEVTGRNKLGKVLVEDSIVVRQLSGLHLEPDSVKFDYEGGDAVVDIITSMDPITVNQVDGQDWLTCDFESDQKAIWLHAAENMGSDRKATITVAAWNPKHEGFNQATLTVRQEGVTDVTLDKYELEFPALGGSQRVGVTMGVRYKFTGVRVEKKDQNWLLAEAGKDYFIVTAIPNTSEEELNTIIYCVVTKTSPVYKGPETVEIPIKVKQLANVAGVDRERLFFYAEGGSQEVKINKGTFLYCNAYLSEEAGDWAKFTLAEDGTVTVTAEPNESPVDRECVLVCYVTDKAEPKDEETLKFYVSVVQEGLTFEPDGPASPIKQIVISTTKYITMITDGEPTDSVYASTMPFTFHPDNSHVVIRKEKNYTHYVCHGFHDEQIGSTGYRLKASLSFDITNDGKVRNLSFNSYGENFFDMIVPGVATSHTVIDSWLKYTVGDFPLSVNGDVYKSSKYPYTVPDGLIFTSYSMRADSRTSYTNHMDNDPMPMVINHMEYPPVDSLDDNLYLIIQLKEDESEPELKWPSEEVMKRLEEGGMPIHKGTYNNNFFGTYIMSPLDVVKNTIGSTEEMEGVTGMVLNFNGMSGGMLDFDYYTVFTDGADIANGSQKALIQGNGNQFSLCTPIDKESTLIVSGTFTPNGLTDVYMCITQTDEPGKYFIMKDQDGGSGKTEWAPAPDDDEEEEDE